VQPSLPSSLDAVSTSSSLRRSLYRSARLLGDAQAIARGPAATGRRYVRKAAYRGTNGMLRVVLRPLGL
jgi:hypothetical protein